MKHRERRTRGVWLKSASALVALGLVAAACGGDDDSSESTGEATAESTAEATAEETGEATAEETGGEEAAPSGDRTINVAIVGNPIIDDIATLVPDHFTAETGIEVNFTVLPEQELREITTRDVGAGGDQFDVVQIGMYETPQFGANGWLVPLNDLAASTPEYEIDDLIPAVRSGLSVDGELYASPFYAESSFLMYRADVMEENGIEMPEAPTWAEVADIARQIDTDEMAGICLRGKPGWGDNSAAFTTVLNTFGGTWWEANEDGSVGASQVDQPEFKETLEFYVNLAQDAGQDDAANSSFNECLTLYQEGKVAMWYDATVAASILEAEDSPVAGLNDFALAPVNVTDNSGWLWAWTFAIPVSTTDQDAAWEFISWATGPGYQELAANELPGGWVAVPPGTRQSLYENPSYLEAAESFAERTLNAMVSAPIDNPGTTPRPGLPGVQYIGIPEWQDVGARCGELISAAIAGSISVDDAISDCHAIASEIST